MTRVGILNTGMTLDMQTQSLIMLLMEWANKEGLNRNVVSKLHFDLVTDMFMKSFHISAEVIKEEFKKYEHVNLKDLIVHIEPHQHDDLHLMPNFIPYWNYSLPRHDAYEMGKMQDGAICLRFWADIKTIEVRKKIKQLADDNV
jgi:hypothetical protein